MKRIYLLLLSLSINIYCAEAQVQRCGTAELHRQRMETDAVYRAYYENIGDRMAAWQNINMAERTNGSVVTIPMVVHVLYNTEEQNISDAQIQSQIDILNHDYTATNANLVAVPPGFRGVIGNPHLNFCLATITPQGDYTVGIERKHVNVASYNIGDNSMKLSVQGGLDSWDRNQYLNIWVCNLAGGQLLGYTDMPGSPAETDGCVVLYAVFGYTGNIYPGYSAYALGRTVTHEIGHWLGLFHVWGDDGGACWGSDHIADTPDQADCTFGCPSFPKKDSCTDTLPGVMYMNYLDYSDDACMSMFSAGQVAVMNAILDTVRSSILTSKGCKAPNGLADINAASFIELYPNPVNDVLHIASHLPIASVLSVTAYDLLGKEVMTEIIVKAGEQNINLDSSSLKAGLYTLVVKTNEGNIAKRFAVAHLK